MLPDHTRLLECCEAFVAVGDESTNCAIACLGNVISMRSPSYFPCDIRKLNNKYNLLIYHTLNV